jgi:hypothetical protein
MQMQLTVSHGSPALPVSTMKKRAGGTFWLLGLYANLLITSHASTARAEELDVKAATQMIETAVEGIWSFDLRLGITQRTLVKPEFAQESGKSVHVRNTKLVKPEIVQLERRQVYRQRKSRVEYLPSASSKPGEPTPPIFVCDGEVVKMWNAANKESIVSPMLFRITPEGLDYRETYSNVLGTISLVSCLKERKGVRISRDKSNGSRFVFDLPTAPPETAVALFNTAFRVTVDSDKGFMPVKIEQLRSVEGKVLTAIAVTVTEWHKLGNGTHVPLRALVEVFDTAPNKGTFGQTMATAELVVDLTHSAWNVEIPDREFELPLPKGTTVSDSVNNVIYVVGDPDPGKNLKEIAASAKDLVATAPAYVPSANTTGNNSRLMLVLGLVALAVVGLIMFFLFAVKRKPSQRT